jgi:hypothetical protein
MRVLFFLLFILFQVFCGAAEKAYVVPITPCRAHNSGHPPITKHCEAAAIAEDAFLKYTKRGGEELPHIPCREHLKEMGVHDPGMGHGCNRAGARRSLAS